MASILKGQSGQPIQFETVPNVNGDDVTTESAISTPNNALIKSALNAGGDAPVYACRAWVNFDGTGTVAIRASGNVSSITDNGIGLYTVNFTTAMPDANYCANFANIQQVSQISGLENVKTSSVRLRTRDSSFNNIDSRGCFATFFR